MRKLFFGQYLLAKGLVTPPQLLAAVEYQNKHNSRLGDLAVAQGLVTQFESQQINAVQVREDRLFGDAAVQLGLLTQEQVQAILDEQRDKHVLLGQAIETLGYMERPAIDAAAEDFLNECGKDDTGIQIPEVVTDKELATTLFNLGHKLLLRAWDLTSKPDQVRIEELRLTLSDRNARVDFMHDSRHGAIMVGVPNDVAWKAAKRYAGEGTPTESEADETVLDFAHLLSENLSSVLAERGRALRLGRITLQGSRATLPPEVKVVVLPYLTHLGQVLIGFSL